VNAAAVAGKTVTLTIDERLQYIAERELAQAVQDRASDIHFEPFEKEFRIRYRVDGSLVDRTPPPLPQQASGFAISLKVTPGMLLRISRGS
jgi:type II secretory ATPase GspE/PulE/Tfp pilus assembly ATPase PilB-like protein